MIKIAWHKKQLSFSPLEIQNTKWANEWMNKWMQWHCISLSIEGGREKQRKSVCISQVQILTEYTQIIITARQNK